MSIQPSIALVTGGNRGIGFEVSRQLAKLGMTVILTSRDTTKGEQAQQLLQNEGLETVVYHPLDVTDENSIITIKKYVQQQFGQLDILVNNAGVFPDASGPSDPMPASAFDVPVDLLRQAMETNVYGPFRLCQMLIPMMWERNYGRVVNVSSGMGQLTNMNGGYPAYRTSKTAINAITRIFTDELVNSNVLVNSVCPGWVRTEMGGMNATRSVQEGADTIVWLATLPDDGPRGSFFRDRQPMPW